MEIESYTELLEAYRPRVYKELLIIKTMRQDKKTYSEIQAYLRVPKSTWHRWRGYLSKFEMENPGIVFTKEDRVEPEAQLKVIYPLVTRKLQDLTEVSKDQNINFARGLANEPNEIGRAALKKSIEPNLEKIVNEYNKYQAILAIWFDDLDFYKGAKYISSNTEGVRSA